MARRKKHAAHENHERWLVSYADFITLLFAFFVVMFASSQTDKAKAAQVAAAVKDALEKGGVPAAVREILGGTVDDKGKGNALMRGPGGAQKATKEPKDAREGAVAQLLPSHEFLSKELKEAVDKKQLQIKLEPRGLVVSLKQASFFPSGGETLDAAMFPNLEKIAATIKTLPNQVRLEGHTDSIPIHNARFRSNWELSAARGIAMLEVFATRFGVPREKMAISGYADTAPVDTNDSDEGRARNRRVDIVILSHETAIKTEPATAATAAAEHQKPAKAH